MRVVQQKVQRSTPAFHLQLEQHKRRIVYCLSSIAADRTKEEERDKNILDTLVELKGRRQSLGETSVDKATLEFVKQVLVLVVGMAQGTVLRWQSQVKESLSKAETFQVEQKNAWSLYVDQFRCLLVGVLEDWEQQTFSFSYAKSVVDYFVGVSLELCKKTDCCREDISEEVRAEIEPIFQTIKECELCLLEMNQEKEVFFRTEVSRLLDKLTSQAKRVLELLVIS